VGRQFRTFRVDWLADRPINNAQLIGSRIYRTRLDLFDRWFVRHGGDVRRSVGALETLMRGVEGDSAYARLEQALEDTTVATVPALDRQQPRATWTPPS
jgi:predicted aminopeptidase